MRIQISRLFQRFITHQQIEVTRRLTLEKLHPLARWLLTKLHHNFDENIIMASYFPAWHSLMKSPRWESPEGQTLSWRQFPSKRDPYPQVLNFPYLCVESPFPEKGGNIVMTMTSIPSFWLVGRLHKPQLLALRASRPWLNAFVSVYTRTFLTG